MYCSIQEAYNEPSFSKPRKSTPNKMQCGPSGPSGSNGQSSTPMANNIYTNQNGQEQSAYTPFNQRNTNQAQQQTPHRRQSPKQLQAPQMVEQFMCGGPASAIPTGSTGKMSKQIDPAAGNIPYAAQANDYKYYCDNMSVCPKPAISIEGFTDNYGSESYLEPANYSEQNQKLRQSQQQAHAQGQQAQQNQYNISQNWQQQQQQQQQQQASMSTQGSCQMPEQSTTYVYPISDETKQQYDAAMRIYMNNGQNTPPQESSSATPMNNVTGLYDDEINQYMRVQDMGLPYTNSTTSIYERANYPSNQYPKQPAVHTPQPSYDNHTVTSPSQFKPATNTALTEAQGKFAPMQGGLLNTPQKDIQQQNISKIPVHSDTPVSSNTPSKTQTSKWQYIMDTVLFIAAGVLIIILCDLLFKMAYSVGMRDTFAMIKPYLEEIEDLKIKIAELVPDDD